MVRYYYPNGSDYGGGSDTSSSEPSSGETSYGGGAPQDVTDTGSDSMSTLFSTLPTAPALIAVLPNVSSEEDVETHLYDGFVTKGFTPIVFDIKFKAKEGSFYSKVPTPNKELYNKKNYKVVSDTEIKNDRGKVIEKTYSVSYTGEDEDEVLEFSDEILFTHETTKIPPIVSEITDISIDTMDIPSKGKSLPINITGAPGTHFTLNIKDLNNTNILPAKKTYTKISKVALTHSTKLFLDDVRVLEVGMVVNGADIGEGVIISSIGDCENPFVTISKPQTIDAGIALKFSKGNLLEKAVIPESGVYRHDQPIPALRKYEKTLKTAASSSTTLLIDDTTNLKVGMRMTGSGVDGGNTRIKTIDSNTQITVSETQTISDETTLTFETYFNRYDITISACPEMGSTLGDNISKIIPTYSIRQYIDPVISFVPSTSLSSVTATGSVSRIKPVNYKPELTPTRNKLAGALYPTRSHKRDQGIVKIRMVATSTSGSLSLDRDPVFSSSDFSSSDFTNTKKLIKTVEVFSGEKTPIVVLNNTTGLAVGMQVTGSGIVQPPYNPDGTIYSEEDCEVTKRVNPDMENVTIESITGNTVTLSWPQTIPCGSANSTLTFDSGGTNISMRDLTAVLSENVDDGVDTPIANGVCTITATAVVSSFGKYSTTFTLNIDNFLSKA